MSRQPLAAVCVLAFAAGASGAVALYYQPQHTAGVSSVAEKSDDAGREARPQADPLTVEAAEDAPAEEVAEASAVVEAEDGVEALDGEAGNRVEDGTGAAAARAHRRAGGVRYAADTRPSAARRYATVSRGSSGGGGVVGGVGGVGRGVAGHTVKGVKKTGTTIGKTFGKIGGVFHD